MNKNLRDKKGFTLIELLVVISIVAILVLLAAPKFLGYTKDAKLAQIKNDIKAYETAIAQELLSNDDFFDGLVLVNNEDLFKYAEEGNLFNKKGIVNSEDVIGTHFEIDGSKFKVDSKLKGQFFTNEKGLVLYYEENFGLSKNEGSKEEIYLAKDEDFAWVNDSSGYKADNQSVNGYYKYIGVGQSKVEIPHVINGHPMTSYFKMFEETGENITKVVSTNPNVTDMAKMFWGSKAKSLDLSSFDTSKVTNMYQMFWHSQATTLDLSSFDTSNVTNMQQMFSWSQATTLDLSSFDTSKVTNMSYMFDSSQAKSLDLSSFDTSEVTNMHSMFSYSKATSLDLSSFDTESVTDMYYMFRQSQATTGYARTQQDASNFNKSSFKPKALNFTTTKP